MSLLISPIISYIGQNDQTTRVGIDGTKTTNRLKLIGKSPSSTPRVTAVPVECMQTTVYIGY